VERGRCENISTLHLSPPALASVSLIEKKQLSLVRLALDSRKRIRPAMGGSLVSGKESREKVKKSETVLK
jgi:hypothetical protein